LRNFSDIFGRVWSWDKTSQLYFSLIWIRTWDLGNYQLLGILLCLCHSVNYGFLAFLECFFHFFGGLYIVIYVKNNGLYEGMLPGGVRTYHRLMASS